MLEAKPNRVMKWWFDQWCRRAIRQHFYRTHLYFENHNEWLSLDPTTSHLIVANHSSFWDGILLYHLLRVRNLQPIYCMIDEVQVRRHPFFRRVGGFSVDRARPRDAMRSLRYAIDLLNRHPCTLIFFPQGKIEPNDVRPLKFESGLSRIVKSVDRLKIIPIAMRYEFWIEQRAEAMIHIGQSIDANRNGILDLAQSRVTDLLDRLKLAGRSYQVGDRILIHGKRSISRKRNDPAP